jgi:hypothetical protein
VGEGAILAFLLYLAVSLLYFGRPVVAHPSASLIGFGTDPSSHVWFLAWWPHAIAHGLNPFVSRFVWAPSGYNLAGSTADPGPSLLLAPVTAAFGPVVAYNVLAVLAPVLSAWAAYLLCRHVSGATGPSLLGGYLFGFCTYELGQMMGHPNLALVAMVPLMVLLVLLRVEGRLSPRRFVVLLAVSLVAQYLVSTEVLFTATVFGFLTLGLAALMMGGEVRGRLRALVPLVALAYGLAAVPLAPFLYYEARNLSHSPIYAFYPSYYSNDLLNFVVPTSLTRVGRGDFARVAAAFSGNVSEQSAYLGLPVVAMLFAFALGRWRRRSTRLLLAALGLVCLASLGPVLHVGGTATMTLPWRWLVSLPLFKYALPGRFMLFAFLIVGVVAALWLAGPGEGEPAWRVWARWSVAALAVLFLLPGLGSPFWHTTVDTPAFFATGAYRGSLHPGENVLVIPYGHNGEAMLWQAMTGFAFRMPEGYVSVVPPPEFADDPFLGTLYNGTPATGVDGQLRAFLRGHQVQAVAVVDGTPGPWDTLFGRLDPSPTDAGGVTVYRVPASVLSGSGG